MALFQMRTLAKSLCVRWPSVNARAGQILCVPTDIVNYSIKDESMEPEILIGQRVIILKRNYIFNEKDIYLILSPYGEMIRRLKRISNESVKLIASNKKCNNETFLFEDIQIIGKVRIC